jgi:hypothetical protein
MSINVFLVFFFRTSPDLFQKRWWVYCVICYGGPFVIALSLLLQRDAGRGPVYGEATVSLNRVWGECPVMECFVDGLILTFYRQIWCWVDREWDEVRIFTYYMLIWVCIFGSLILYFLVGYQVFRARDELRSFSTAKSRDDVVHMSAGESGLQDPRLVLLPNVPQDGFYGTVITEVQVIHSAASSSTLPSEPKRVHIMSSATEVSFDEFERTKCDRECQGTSPSNQYYSTVTSSRSSRRKAPPTIWGRITAGLRTLLNKFVVEDPIKAAYLRTSLLFAISVLVTWIPSSMNRIHSWIAGQSPFEYHVATAAVLPLQGLWNAVIFFVTSYEVLKRRLMHLWSSGQAGDSSAAAGPNKGGATPGRRSTNRRLDGLETSDDEDDEAIIADEGIFADVQIDDSAIELRRVSQSLKKGTCRG